MADRSPARRSAPLVDTRQQFDQLAGLYWPVAVAVFAIVAGLLVLVAVRFRHRPGRSVSPRTEAPRAEFAYVVGLTIVVGLLTAATFPTESRVDRLVRSPDLRIVAIASDWRWRFDYPLQGITELGRGQAPASLVVPAGETIEFDLQSTDVLHAFYIPGVDFQREAIPGLTSRFDLVFRHAGRQTSGVCNEYCGLGHTQMRFAVRILSAADFAAWAERRRAGTAAP